MPLRIIVRCPESDCYSPLVYDQSSKSLAPCVICRKGPKDLKEWSENILAQAATFTSEDRITAIAWLTARREEEKQEGV